MLILIYKNKELVDRYRSKDGTNKEQLAQFQMYWQHNHTNDMTYEIAVDVRSKTDRANRANVMPLSNEVFDSISKQSNGIPEQKILNHLLDGEKWETRDFTYELTK